MSRKSQTIWDFTFSRLPRFCRLMTTRNRKYPRSSGMDGDKSGASRAFLFSRRVADFCDGRRSFPTNENSNLYRRGRRRNVGGGFRSLPIPRIVGLQSPYHASFNFWRTSISCQIHRESQRQNCGDYQSDISGTVGKK